jgi:histidyl-tRNA synthetase
MFPAAVAEAAVDVLVTLWNDSMRAEAIALASELRRAGLRVDVYPDADKVGKQFKYAAAQHVPFVAVIGDDERAAGTVSFKEMRTGEQRSVPRAEAAALVLKALKPE